MGKLSFAMLGAWFVISAVTPIHLLHSLQAPQQRGNRQQPAPPVAISCSCTWKDVSKDWGMDIEASFRQSIAEGNDFENAAYEAIRAYRYTDIGNDRKVVEAKNMFRKSPKTPWPPLLRIEDMKGFYAAIFYRLGEQKQVAFIMISRPLFDAVDIPMLSAILAHEISHPEADAGGVSNHSLVDRIAIEMIDALDLERVLLFINNAKRRYEQCTQTICDSRTPLPDLFLGEDTKPRLDSLTAHPR